MKSTLYMNLENKESVNDSQKGFSEVSENLNAKNSVESRSSSAFQNGIENTLSSFSGNEFSDSELQFKTETRSLQKSRSKKSNNANLIESEVLSISPKASKTLVEEMLWESMTKSALRNNKSNSFIYSSLISKSYVTEFMQKCGMDEVMNRMAIFLFSRPFWQIVSVAQWSFFNILMFLMNNQIFQIYEFRFPLSLTAIHFFISFLVAFFAIEILGLRQKSHVATLDHLYWVLPMAAASSFNVVLGNFSLRYIPLPFLQTVRSFAPVITVLLQRVFLHRILNSHIYFSLFPIVLGAILSYAPDIHFDLFPFLSALASSIIGSFTVIFAELLLQHKTNNLDSLNSLYHMLPYSLLLLFFPALFFEGKQLLVWFQSSTNVFAVISALLFSGVIAFCLNFSLFYTLQATSAVTFNVAGNLKVALTVVVSWFLFNSPIQAISLLGCLITVLGVFWYGIALYKDRQDKIQARIMAGLSAEEIDEEEVVDIYLGAMI